MKALKSIILVLACSASLHAETVYFTAHGKTYHNRPHWSHAEVVYHADRKLAEEHGLTPCKTCYKPRKTHELEWAIPTQEGGR